MPTAYGTIEKFTLYTLESVTMFMTAIKKTIGIAVNLTYQAHDASKTSFTFQTSLYLAQHPRK